MTAPDPALTEQTLEILREARRAVGYGDWVAAATACHRLSPSSVPVQLRNELLLLRDPSALAPAELRRITEDILSSLPDRSTTPETAAPTAFIVHGWDAELKWETKNYIQGVLGIPCVILHEQDGAGGTLIDKFERCAATSSLAIVLMSEADEGSSSGFVSPDDQRRPRPNVLFEMGYFFARLGRERVLLLRKGDVLIHSDILGIEYIDVGNGVEAAGESIRRRLSWCL